MWLRGSQRTRQGVGNDGRVNPYLLLGASLLCILGSASYMLWPIGEDPGIHLAGVHQGLTTERGLLGAWTFRGIAYNAYLAVLYLGASCFVDFFDSGAFDPFVKAEHLVLTVIVCVVWARGIAACYGLGRQGCVLAGTILLFTLISGASQRALHAEHVAITLAALAWGLALSKHQAARDVAALLLGVLPLMKGITAVYALPVLCAAADAYGLRSRACLRLALGSGLSALALIGLVWTGAPVQLTDLVDASVFQASFAASIESRLVLLVQKGPRFLYSEPSLLSGFVAAAVHVCVAAERRRVWEVLTVGSLWFVAIGCAVIQNAYFSYHLVPASLASAYSLSALSTWAASTRMHLATRAALLLVCLPCLASAAAYFAWDRSGLFAANARLMTSGVCACTALVLVVAFARDKARVTRHWTIAPLLIAMMINWVGSTQAAALPDRVQRAWRKVTQTDAAFARVQRKYHLQGQSLLLLAYGSAARHLDVRSACRHFFPIPTQRFAPRRRHAFEQAPGFRENRDCIREFEGAYLLLETTWYNPSKLPELRATLDRFKTVRQFRVGKRHFELMRRRPGRKGWPPSLRDARAHPHAAQGRLWLSDPRSRDA